MSDAAPKKRPGPTQERIEELADYYDRMDTGDLPWEETEDVIVERLELEQISIKLPKEDLEHIRRRAAEAGVGYTTLIRMILRAHIDDPLTRNRVGGEEPPRGFDLSAFSRPCPTPLVANGWQLFRSRRLRTYLP